MYLHVLFNCGFVSTEVIDILAAFHVLFLLYSKPEEHLSLITKQ